MNVDILSCGYCVHSEFVTRRGGGVRAVEFPSTVVVIEHPREGVILFDTGYTNAMIEQTRRFPERLYAMVTPVSVSEEQTARSQLARRGIQPGDVRHIVLSHFHADHVAGLRDFPAARLHYAASAWEPLRRMGRWRGVVNGFLAGLLPDDFAARSRAYSDAELVSGRTGCEVFTAGLPLFGDDRIFLVPLPGHAPGHLGLLVRDGGAMAFFVGDACWHEGNFRHDEPPLRLAISLLGDYPRYASTLARLKSFGDEYPHAAIVPCHCSGSHRRFQWPRVEAEASP